MAGQLDTFAIYPPLSSVHSHATRGEEQAYPHPGGAWTEEQGRHMRRQQQDELDTLITNRNGVAYTISNGVFLEV